MVDIFEKLAALRTVYPDDVARIEADEKRVSDLLRVQSFSELDTTKELIALCREDIVFSRIKLAKERALTEDQRGALWHIIDCREWFLKMVAKDFKGELEQIDRELEAELTR